MSHATLLPPALGRPSRPWTRRIPRRALLAAAPVAALAAGAATFAGPWAAHRSASRPDGIVALTSNPEGATVLVDGEARGRTPERLPLAPGDHHLLIEHPEAIAGQAQVRVEAEHVHALTAALWRRQPTAVLLRPPLPGGAVADAAFLADGGLALLVTVPPGDDYQLWRRDPDGRLTPLGPADAPGPLAAAPDGRTVAYLAPAAPPTSKSAAAFGDAPLVSVWTVTADGRRATRRFTLPSGAADMQLSALSWSPDGAHLLLVSTHRLSGDAVRAQLLWLDAVHGTARPIAELPSAVLPAGVLWSPGGGHAAFLARSNSLVSLCLLALAPPGVRSLADLGQDAAAPPLPPLTWSPDGAQIVYAAPVSAPAASLGGLLLGPRTASALFRTAVADAQSVRLGTGFGSSPVWRPDGSLLALVTGSGANAWRWETVDPATGRVVTQTPAGLPAGGVAAVGWDAAHQQALLLQRRDAGLAFWLLSFAEGAE